MKPLQSSEQNPIVFNKRPLHDLKNFYKNKNVLVTGGAGFIGSHIAEKLCQYQANVTVLDDLSTGSIKNLESFCHKINFLAHDITSFKKCLKATKKQDIVFHTAAFVSVPESIKHPAICEKINIDGTNNLLEAAKINNVKTFIFSSSASVYGNRNDICSEKDNPNPESPYAKSKLSSEKLCIEYSKKYRLNTASLRYFNVYGNRQNPNGAYAGVVAKFKHNLIHKKPIIIYGNGKQKRDFIHVSKVSEANLKIGTILPLQGEIFNIASGNSINLFELIRKLKKDTGCKPTQVLFQPARKGDIFNSIAHVAHYKSL
jgi:UDP-glucose 4-epimerase